LPRLQRDYPDLRLEVRETQTEFLLEELARGELDCVMLALPVDHADVTVLPLFDDPFVLAAPANEYLPKRGRIRIGDVDQTRLILLEEGHCLRDQALAFCGAPRRDMPAGLGATSLATVMQMVANGYGVTLLPQVAAKVEARDARVRLLRFAAPEPARSIGLAWRQTSPRGKDFQALSRIVTKTLGFPAPEDRRVR
jgi:LysR family hydrogen peroxide-inducible transcriptional activator